MSKPDILFKLDMSKPLRDKDGLSWGDKRDKIILACLGVGESEQQMMNDVAKTGCTYSYTTVKGDVPPHTVHRTSSPDWDRPIPDIATVTSATSPCEAHQATNRA